MIIIDLIITPKSVIIIDLIITPKSVIIIYRSYHHSEERDHYRSYHHSVECDFVQKERQIEREITYTDIIHTNLVYMHTQLPHTNTIQTIHTNTHYKHITHSHKFIQSQILLLGPPSIPNLHSIIMNRVRVYNLL